MEILTQILEMFAVNWEKFIAQVITFTVVYIILSKFAFKPIIDMLEERRRLIEEGQANAEKIKQQLADAEKRYEEILGKANTEAQAMIDEAKKSSSSLAEKKQQEAISQAEQIIAKAKEATEIERAKVLKELKHEIGALVVETTSKVTGKILTPEDQKRLNEEAARQVAA